MYGDFWCIYDLVFSENRCELMAQSSKDRHEKLNGTSALMPYFRGGGPGSTLRVGAELELMLMKRTRDGALLVVSDYENKRLSEHLATPGPDGQLSAANFSNEPPASMVELKTAPYTLAELFNVNAEMATAKATLIRKAASLEIPAEELEQAGQAINASGSELTLPDRPLYQGELLVCPFAILPFASAAQMMDNIISARGEGDNYSDRPRKLMRSFTQAMNREAAVYPVTNTAVHVTHTATDMQHAFEMSRLQSAMMPFLFVLTENRPPYQRGSENRTTVHSGVMARLSLNSRTAFNKSQRGLIPDILWNARNAEDFARQISKTVLSTPMLAYWDHNGKFTPAPLDTPITPLKMNGLGPSDISQFELAMSQFWWSFKYKFHPKEKGALLHELRDFDSGPATVAHISLVMGMLALDEARRKQMTSLLEDKYGIPLMSDPKRARAVIMRNIRGALHRGSEKHNPGCGGRFMNTPFGTNGHTMQHFLQNDLMPMAEAFYQDKPEQAQLESLRYVAATGMTDAQLWYDSFESPEAQTEALLAMTADPAHYNQLLGEGKSWAHLHAEGKLPYLKAPAAKP